jgi:hypothetical protein
MTIKEQFEQVMTIARKPQKDINRTDLAAKALTLVAALEDEKNEVDKSVFECLTDEELRGILGGFIGLVGSLALQD